jgi:hypothetical protein
VIARCEISASLDARVRRARAAFASSTRFDAVGTGVLR